MRFQVIAGLLALAACNSSSETGASPASFPVMLRVVNTSDATIRIGGFPNFHPAIPQPSGGLLTLGMAPPGISCFAFPDSIVMHGNPGTPSASTITWHAASDQVSLIGVASSGNFQDGFVPGAAHGWTITVPASSTAPTPAIPCTP